MATLQKSKADGENADELGEAGENAFRTWCSVVRGLTVTRPERDKHGWDFYVQLRTVFEQTVGFFDQLPPELAFKVQVKGTIGKGRRIPIKLDNWFRMVSDPIPWFVVVFRFKSIDAPPVAAYLIHVDIGHVERVLRRMSELSPAEAEGLHRIKQVLVWDESHRLEFPDGKKLISAIAGIVGDGHTYVENKVNAYRTVGYEERPYVAKFAFSGGSRREIFDNMANWAIGVDKKAQIQKYETSVTRFGTTRPVGKRRGSAELSIPDLPSSGIIYVTMTDDARTRVVSVKCKVYDSASMFPFLPPDHRKFRFASRAVTFVVESAGEVHAIRPRIHFHPRNKPTRLTSFVKFGKMVLLLGMAQQNGLRIAVRRHSLDAASDAVPVASESRLEERIMAAASVFEHLGNVVAQLGINPAVRMLHADIWAQKNKIISMSQVLEPGVRLWFEVTGLNISVREFEGKELATVRAVVLLLGGYRCVVVFSVEGVASVEGTDLTTKQPTCTLSVKDGRVRVHAKYVVPSEDWDASAVASGIEQATGALVREGIAIVRD